MPFEIGNRAWEARSSHGRAPKYEDPAALWDECLAYFDWVVDNPMVERKVAITRDGPIDYELKKMRPMTISGLCNHLRIVRSTWDDWKQRRHDLSEVIAHVEQIMYQHKFEGAAADLLNANIIARDLGLADKTDTSGVVHITLAGHDASL